MDYAEYKQSLALAFLAVGLSLLAATATWTTSRPLAWAALALSAAAALYIGWRRRKGLRKAGALPAAKVVAWQRLVISATILFFLTGAVLMASLSHLGVSPEAKIACFTLITALYVLSAAVTVRIQVTYGEDE